MFKYAVPYTGLDIGNSVAELLDDSLPFERLDRVRLSRRWHNDESNNSDSRASLLKAVVEASKRLDEHVDTLVAVLVPSSSEHIQCIVDIKVIMSVEMPTDELIDLRLGCGVQVLELVHRLEFDDVKPVGDDAVGLSFEEMLRLVRGDVRYSREYVRAVRSGALDAVAVVDSAFARFVIDVEVLQVVVKVD